MKALSFIKDKEGLYLIGALLIITGLFFSRAILSIGTVVIAVSLVPRLIVNGFSVLKEPMVVLLIIWMSYLALSIFWTPAIHMANYNKELASRMGMFAVFVGSVNAHISKRYLKIIFMYFLIALTIVSVATFLNYLMHYDTINESIKHSKPIPIINGFSHISFSCMLAFGICLSAYLMKNYLLEFKAWQKKILLVLTVLNFILIHVIAARTGLVALYGVAVFYLMYKNLKERKYLRIAIGLLSFISLISILIIVIPSLNNRFNNTIVDFKTAINGNNSNFYSGAMRVEAIKTGIQVFVENPIIGVGMANLDTEMAKMYQTRKTLLLDENRIMPHNQLVNYLATGGIIGLLLFLLFVLSFFRYQSISVLSLFSLFALLCLIAFQFEALLERQTGSIFFSFTWMLLYYSEKYVFIKKEVKY